MFSSGYKQTVFSRAVGNGQSAVDTVIGIDRKKVLQTATLRSVRAMRSVFCDAY
jgi:hypothetical protein